MALLAVAALALIFSQRLRNAVNIGGAAFVDIMQVTYSADCPHADAAVVGAVTCDPLGRPYNYPPVWAWAFRAVGVTRDATPWVATGLAVAALVAIGSGLWALRRRLDSVGIAAVGAVVISPPMMLVLVRANTDLIVIVLVVAAIAVASRPGGWIAAALLVGLSSGLKLYPVGAVLGLVRTRRATIAAALAAGVAVSTLALPWLTGIRAGTPAITESSFGAGVLPAATRGAATVGSADQLIGVIALVVAAAAGACWPAIRCEAVRIAERARNDTTVGLVGGAGAGMFLTTYVLTTSYEYRLWTIGLVAAGLVLAGCARSRVGRGILAVAVATPWLTFPLRGAQIIGDVTALVLAAALLIIASAAISRAVLVRLP